MFSILALDVLKKLPGVFPLSDFCEQPFGVWNYLGIVFKHSGLGLLELGLALGWAS